ncbi:MULTISPECIES: cold-shock protein [Kitasatospora]|uniref:cold-shock protein n=1 Tax=Kitasatospora TaxID=2063 RepID=UPI0004C35E95|nr:MULTISPECIES: cold shock domain-containing protein [unclassified Kitasatospora]WAL75270.1 cold shock domain-containing protein [Kitasatospora sp. YST-16]WNW41327.1 cold shock domain-containing protein [Streptomyces sp. Li-HN-5-13]
METGTVKWFNPDHGYGYITPDTGGPDVAVYYDSVLADTDAHRYLHQGQRVRYDEKLEEFRPVAEHVTPLTP